MLLKGIQSQLKTIQPQFKKGRHEKNNTGEPKRLFSLQMLVPIYNCKCKGPQGSTLCGPVLQFFKRILKKDNSCFGEGNF